MSFDVAAPMAEVKFRQLVDSGHVDTVLVTFTDAQGRLQGKRFQAKHFINSVISNGTQIPYGLIGTDIEMRELPSHAEIGLEQSLNDMVLRPDMSTLRTARWLPSTVMVQSDVQWQDGAAVDYSPRQILAQQIQRATALGCSMVAATEIEFMIFDEGYEEAWHGDYQRMSPGSRFNADHSIVSSTQLEPVLRDIRNAVYQAGIDVEFSKAGAALGQYEIATAATNALTAADNHVVVKNAIKEVAIRHGKSVTFMAKLPSGAANSAHIHLRMIDGEGHEAFSDSHGNPNDIFRRFLGGVMNSLLDFSLFYAPNINSYKRLVPDSQAPTTVSWGWNNRTCAIRVIGQSQSLRMENRIPGADTNPYLALAAMIAGGLRGLELDRAPAPPDPVKGSAYRCSSAPVPTRNQQRSELGLEPGAPKLFSAEQLGVELLGLPQSLEQARDLFASSPIAQAAFGPGVVDHYVALADHELAAYHSEVTNWEMRRGFERI